MREREEATRSRRACAQRGQAVVEFALSAIVLTLLLGATIDLGHAFYVDVTLHDAAREGARHGVWFDVSGSTNPYLSDSSIESAVNDVLTSDSLGTVSALDPGGVQCPTPTDGNAYYNPPYVSSAAPSTPGGVNLFICYNNTPGQTAGNTAELQDVNVILIHRLSFFEPYLPSQGFGSVIIAENQHMAVQGN